MQHYDGLTHVDELARELLVLPLGQQLGVYRDAALGPAKGHVHQRGLPGVEGGQAVKGGVGAEWGGGGEGEQ